MEVEKYENRQEAGKILAEQLKEYANRSDVIILALPRGGVPIAYEIAKELNLPLDVFIVRKLGVPRHEELAMGAIAMGGTKVLNENIIQELHISSDDIEEVAAAELQELKRREIVYRKNKPPLDVKNKVVILVDDGIATGATIRAAVAALRQLHPSFIVIAVPVAEVTTCEKMALIADRVVCPLKPRYFYAVGAHYHHFDQTSDKEVTDLLSKSRHN